MLKSSNPQSQATRHSTEGHAEVQVTNEYIELISFTIQSRFFAFAE